MKRDMDLIRKLLFHFEERDELSMVRSSAVVIPGYEQRLVAYHINLMCEAGLLSCEKIVSSTTADRVIDAHPFRLTWEGHEFLDAARSDAVWERAKAALHDRALPAAYGVLKALLIQLGKGELGLA